MSLLGEWLQYVKADLVFSPIWLVCTATVNTKLWHDFPSGQITPWSSDLQSQGHLQTTSMLMYNILLTVGHLNIWLNQKTNRLCSVKTWDIWSALKEAFFYGVNLWVSQASSPLKHLLKTRCWKDKAAVHRAYYKLAVTSASPKPTDECDCFFPPSTCTGVLSHMHSNVLYAVCERAQGMGNEDRWGSFKEPGFTNREVSWSSNSPCSLRKAELLQCLAAS